jgi:hypothetical protein
MMKAARFRGYEKNVALFFICHENPPVRLEFEFVFVDIALS